MQEQIAQVRDDKDPAEGRKPFIFQKDQVEKAKAEAVKDFEYRSGKARKMMQQNPGYRRVFYGLLNKCKGEPVLLSDLETYVPTFPGYEQLRQPPYFPIHWLDEAYALEEMYFDVEGRLYAWEDVEHLTENEFDDLVVAYAYRTTDVGEVMLEEFSPAKQITALMKEIPGREQLYLDLLEFLQTKRNLGEIDRLLRGREELTTTSQDGVTITPGTFVDKLASVGGAYFDGGWIITDEGRELLEALRN